MSINPIDIDGWPHFASTQDALRAFGISRATFLARRRRGQTLPQALGIEPIKRHRASWSSNGIQDENGDAVSYGCYLLYEIVNLVNGKTYVGLTVQSLKTRYEGHVFCSKTLNYPLYSAMRKYGLKNFEIRLIRDDARSGHDLQTQEIKEIARRNSTNRNVGYNLHPGGQLGRGKNVVVAEMHFGSHSEAAHYYGILPSLFLKRISNDKWTPEQAAEIEPPPNLRRHKVILEGENIGLKEATRRLGICYVAVLRRIANGWSREQALGIVPPPQSYEQNRVRRGNETGKQTVVFGQIYSSLSACARAHQVLVGSINYRISIGDTVEEAIIHLKIHQRAIQS
jgi:hypothetical protein